MVAIKNIILFAVGATAAAVLRRDVAALQTDLNTINSDTVALNKAVKGYSGGVFGAIPVTNAESQLENDIKSATSDAQGESPLSSSDAQSLIDYINSTLEPNIASTITSLEAKKSQFASAGLTGTVQKDLANLKSETDNYGAALINLAPSDKTSAAQAALNKIDADFQGAINYFA